MRTHDQMMELILGFAQRDARVRAVCMNGSRANPLAPVDVYQDYDIVYLVQETASFLRDHRWVDVFGERVIMQMPDRMCPLSTDGDGRFHYLMQFTDTNRMDLTLLPLAYADAYIREDSETITLLDKDALLPPLPEPSDAQYHVCRPTQEIFSNCCNEFWWVCPYVDKGLRRGEILYALAHLNGPVRDMLLQMLSWLAGVRTDFTVSTGKCYKYLERYLHEGECNALLCTFPGASQTQIRAALEEACALFILAAHSVAQALNLCYAQEEENRVICFLHRP